MCTVTFVPGANGEFVLTSSRDENPGRKTLKPRKYERFGAEIFFPKDAVAGGTWLAVSPQKKVACLLNGAQKNHTKKERYKGSRGTILLESFSFRGINDFISTVDFEGFEPFTLLLLDGSRSNDLEFVQVRWDEENIMVENIDVSLPHIWSSATLYNEDAKSLREKVFKEWVTAQRRLIHPDEIFYFHNSKHGLEPSIDILMERSENLKTVSISQIEMLTEKLTFTYTDLIDKTSGVTSVPFRFHE